MAFREWVVEILKEAGRPLHYREVGLLLKEKGHWREVQDPVKIARIRLSALARWHRSPVVALGKGVYALKEEADTSPGP